MTQGMPTAECCPVLMPVLDLKLRHRPRGIAKHRTYVEITSFRQRRASQMPHRCPAPTKKPPLTAYSREVPRPQLQNGSVGYSRPLRPTPRCAGPSGPAWCLAGRALGRRGPVVHWQETPERKQILRSPVSSSSLAADALGSCSCTCGAPRGAPGHCRTCWAAGRGAASARRSAGRARRRTPSGAGAAGTPSCATTPAPPSPRGRHHGMIRRAATMRASHPRSSGGATSPAACWPLPCESWKCVVIVGAAAPGQILLCAWTAWTEVPSGWLHALAGSGWWAGQNSADRSSAVR
mmetsp:Transcript_56466/g.160301  ORF Transcript_56466/g.160301 Transcript_56466/m.160301 type:complete len:293 (-) Transcript_56466:221-1099(-)